MGQDREATKMRCHMNDLGALVDSQLFNSFVFVSLQLSLG